MENLLYALLFLFQNEEVKAFFYLLILSTFITIYKRFVFPFSFVSGVANIYLTPKIYLTDLGVILLAFFEIIYFFGSSGGFIKAKKYLSENLDLVIFILALMVSVAFSNFPDLSIYVFVRLLLPLPVFFFILSSQFNYQKMVRYLTIPVIIASVFALFQWSHQHYILGFFPFGEALFSSSSANAPLVNYFGSLQLRAFGTFPHPNVLGGFLVISLMLILDLWKTDRSRISRIYLFIIFLLGFSALYFSFSQNAWGAFVLGLATYSLWFPLREKHFYKKGLLVVLIGLISLLSLWLIYSLSFDSPSDHRRLGLASEALSLFGQHPFLGVGLGNFVKYSHYYWKEPVHNIFLLVLSETGILGFLAFLTLFLSSLKNSLRLYGDSPRSLSLLVIIIFLSLFDHYLLTSAVGLLLFWLVLGISRRSRL